MAALSLALAIQVGCSSKGTTTSGMDGGGDTGAGSGGSSGSGGDRAGGSGGDGAGGSGGDRAGGSGGNGGNAGSGGGSGTGGSAGSAGGSGGRGGNAGSGGGSGTGGSGTGGTGTGGTGAGSGGRAGGGTGGGAGGTGVPVPCPASMPVAGAACTGDANCTFGDDPSLLCRPRARCAGGSWVVMPAPGYCTAPRDPLCPSDGPASVPQCTLGMSCFYSPRLCACRPCQCNVPGCYPSCGGQPMNTPTWDCTAAQGPGAPPCPAIIPNDGARCELPEDTACPASSCYPQFGYDVRCTGGVWRWTMRNLCPVG
jgi:hypothetical protein